MKKTLLTLFSSIAIFASINAQVSIYSFAASSSTYTPITGGTVLGDTTIDEERFVDPSALAGSTTVLTGVGFPIGFNFTYNNQVFDRLAVNTNGWISLGQSSLSPSVNINSSSSFTNPLAATSTATPTFLRNRIAAFGDDIDAQNGSELRIETIGTAPNRICVIQWKNFKKFSTGNGDSYNFQLRLKETSNVVEVVYGNFTNNATPNTVQVGLGGTTNADYNARGTTTSWTATTAATSNTGNLTVTSTIKPASGLTYTWTPPAPCSGTPTAGTASASVNSICAGIGFDLTLTGYTSGASGISLQWQSASAMNGTFNNIVGATTSTYTVSSQSATTYYQCVVACSAGLSSTSNIITVINNAAMDCYCESAATSVKDEEIANVTVGTLNNSSSCSQTGGAGSVLSKYSDYTTSVIAPNLVAGSTVNFSVQIDTCNPTSVTSVYSNAIKIYVDFNQNGSFTDTLEMVYVSDTAKGPQTITGNFVVPTVNVLNGNTRMRIVCKETSDATSITSCGTYSWGETEDYLVNITGGVDPIDPNVGIEENEVFGNVSIYPNPSTGVFNIVANNTKAETITLQVLDLQGKVVYGVSDKSVSANYNKSINLEGIAKGLYYIKLTSENGSKVQKIIIQ